MGLRVSRTLAVTVVAVLALSGCTTQRYWGGTSTAGHGGPAKIGLVTKTETNPYFVVLRQAAKAEAASKGASFVALAGKFDGDNDGQVTAIENLIQQGVTTILITPNTASGVLGAIAQARARGILVIALDTATEPASAVDATYATDNQAAGRQQGAYLKAALKGAQPHVLMIDGTAGATVDTQRHNGFLQGIGLTNSSRRRSWGTSPPMVTRTKPSRRWKTCCSATPTSTSSIR
ncbi:substrate-binding domain-containing protein [Fodinicola feengrottensis]|uniref:substrate-binding domain-containing protein n=1 Tax=Fodinicola feengrottensis TaxID=435914 RepID=UPI002442FC19|nr:substrate-binding domain-containing protein [Fodinicola feengrottensis]